METGVGDLGLLLEFLRMGSVFGFHVDAGFEGFGMSFALVFKVDV